MKALPFAISPFVGAMSLLNRAGKKRPGTVVNVNPAGYPATPGSSPAMPGAGAGVGIGPAAVMGADSTVRPARYGGAADMTSGYGGY